MGFSASSINWHGDSPADVCCRPLDGRGSETADVLAVRKRIRSFLLGCDVSSRFLLIHHRLCQEHKPREGHQESPSRTKAVVTKIRSCIPDFEFVEVTGYELATDKDILLSHEREKHYYIRFV